MTRRQSLKCNECHYTTDAPDKMHHFVDMEISYIDTERIQHRLRLDFCSESCRDSFIEDHEI